jgi:membrane associated rhomboid family serine protease
VTLKTALIAVGAVAALLGAALIAIPSAQERLQPCLEFPRCLGF